MPPFKPGQSGNPNGRPRGSEGLARYIKDKTRNGAALVDIAWAIASSKEEESSERLKAVQWLSDRGFGKAPQTIEVAQVSLERQIDFSKLTNEELDQYIALAEKAEVVVTNDSESEPADPSEDGEGEA